MKRHWYAKKSGNDTQGIVVEEETGRTVAVAYDRKDTALLAAAPEMLELLEEVYDWLDDDDSYGATIKRQKLAAVINKTQEEE